MIHLESARIELDVLLNVVKGMGDENVVAIFVLQKVVIA